MSQQKRGTSSSPSFSSSRAASLTTISSPLSSIHLKSIPSISSCLMSDPHALDNRERAASLCRNNNINQLEDLFALDAFSIDEKDEHGNALIHVAAQNGNKKILKILLRHGAQLNAKNSNGQTPLHYCFAYGYKELGEYLISKGADDSICNKDGLTCYEGLVDRDISAS